MLNRLGIALVTVSLLGASPSAAFALSGNDYQKQPELARSMYVAGVIEGWQTLAVMVVERKLQAPEVDTLYFPIVRCVEKGMTRGQTLAIVDKYMTENPARWHEQMGVLVWMAMTDACR